MSNPRAKAERSATKDQRQQPAPDAPSTGKRKKRIAKPYRIMAKGLGGGWFIWKKFATPGQRQDYMDKQGMVGGGIFQFKFEDDV